MIAATGMPPPGVHASPPPATALVLAGLLVVATAAAGIAAPAAGRFPLVLYAPGSSSQPLENVTLCEYLASHGFVVAACPSQGPRTPTMPREAAGLEAQVADLALVQDVMAGDPRVDAARIGEIGFSWGGIAVLVHALRDPAVDAVVCLDGSFVFDPPGRQEMMAATPGYAPANLEAPLLLMFSRPPAGRVIITDFIDAIRDVDVWRLDFPGLGHHCFASDLIAGLVFAGETWEGIERETVTRGYAAVCRYALHFLRAELVEDAGSAAFLRREPQEHGLPAEVVRITRRP